jgi:hemerythrin-like metal-binding protein
MKHLLSILVSPKRLEAVMLIEWSDELSVGIDEIDEDHKHLVAIVNNFHEVFRNDASKDATLKALSEIADYTTWHFEHEEKLMYKHKFPRLTQHQHQHATLLKDLGILIADFENGRADISQATMDFLREWLLVHLQNEDYELGIWVRRNRSSSEIFKPYSQG